MTNSNELKAGAIQHPDYKKALRIERLLKAWQGITDGDPVWDAMVANGVERCSASYLSNVTGKSASEISKHLRNLVELGLATMIQDGNYRLYSHNFDTCLVVNAAIEDADNVLYRWKENMSSAKALTNPLRFKIWMLLLKSEMSVGALQREIGVIQPAVSQALKILSDALIVDSIPMGAARVYRTTFFGANPFKPFENYFKMTGMFVD